MSEEKQNGVTEAIKEEINKDPSLRDNPEIEKTMEDISQMAQSMHGSQTPSDTDPETDPEIDPETVRTGLLAGPQFSVPSVKPSTGTPKVKEPEAKPAKSGGKRGEGATQQPRNLFKNVLPPDQTLMVYWRNEDGEYEFDREVKWRDIKNSGSIDVYLKKYCGSGEYQIDLKNAKGEQSTVCTTNVRKQREGDRGIMATKELHELQRSMTEAARKEADEKTNLIMEVVKGNKGDNAAAAMMPLLLMALKPDPMDKMVQMMMMERLDRSANPPAVPLPPVPQAPPSGASEMAEIMKGMVEIAKAQAPQQSSLTENLLNLVLSTFKKEDNRSDLKDLLDVMNKSRELFNPGVSDFQTQLEHYDKIQERLDRMGRRESDAGQIFSQLGEALASTVSSFRDMKYMAMQEQQGTEMSPENAPQQEQAQQPAPNLQGDTPIPQHSEQAHVTPPPRNAPPLIPIGFRRYTIRMKKAAGEGNEMEILKAFIEGLVFLFEKGDKRWSVHIDQFLYFLRENDKERAMKFVYAFLRTFEVNRLITPEIAETAYESFNIYWDDIKGMLAEILKEYGFEKPAEAQAPNEQGIEETKPEPITAPSPMVDSEETEDEEAEEETANIDA